MDSLPNGSKLIMLFGEIDCREGLLLAVQKMKVSLQEVVHVLSAACCCQLPADG